MSNSKTSASANAAQSSTPSPSAPTAPVTVVPPPAAVATENSEEWVSVRKPGFLSGVLPFGGLATDLRKAAPGHTYGSAVKDLALVASTATLTVLRFLGK